MIKGSGETLICWDSPFDYASSIYEVNLWTILIEVYAHAYLTLMT